MNCGNYSSLLVFLYILNAIVAFFTIDRAVHEIHILLVRQTNSKTFVHHSIRSTLLSEEVVVFQPTAESSSARRSWQADRCPSFSHVCPPIDRHVINPSLAWRVAWPLLAPAWAILLEKYPPTEIRWWKNKIYYEISLAKVYSPTFLGFVPQHDPRYTFSVSTKKK